MTDGQTDRQTDRQTELPWHIRAIAMLSRVKTNHQFFQTSCCHKDTIILAFQCLFIHTVHYIRINSYIQCFEAVGWVAGRVSSLEKTQWSYAGVVMCLGQRADLHMAQLMSLPFTISCPSKSRLTLPFWFHLSGASSPR